MKPSTQKHEPRLSKRPQNKTRLRKRAVPDGQTAWRLHSEGKTGASREAVFTEGYSEPASGSTRIPATASCSPTGGMRT